MANLLGGIYITFDKPYINQVADLIKNKKEMTIAKTKQKVELTPEIKKFLEAVKAKSQTRINSVLKKGTRFNTIFNGYKWTEIDKEQFTGGSGQPDAKTTQKQELASLYAIQKSIENNGYTDQGKFMKLYRDDLKKIYPDMNEEWENTFFQQQLATYKEVGRTKFGKYGHYSRDGGFMDYITDICKNKYGISKKDNWNPADIWLVSDFNKVKNTLKQKVLDDVTSLEEFNVILREMFHERRIVGISLKKMSGKTAIWELVNLENMDIFDDKEYNFKLDSIDINLDVKSNGEFKNSDTKIIISGKKGKIKFQLRQNSVGFNNLKIEGTDLGAASARLGKVPLDMAKTVFDQEKLNWDNMNKNFPRTYADFNKEYDKFLYKFKKIKQYTGITENNFKKNFASAYNTSRPDFAHSKLMQMHLVCEIVSLEGEKLDDLLTTLAFLAQKKGKVFGPFGKLY